VRAYLLLAITLLASASFADAQKVTLPLWPNGAPEPYTGGPEKDITRPVDALVAGKQLEHITNVSQPTLAYYPAEAAKNTGATGGRSSGGASLSPFTTVSKSCVRYRLPTSGIASSA